MVRLSTRSFLHLVPEIVEGDFDEPFYAKVVQLDGDEVVFNSFEGGEGRVPRQIAAEHTVPAGVVKKIGSISLLRCVVSVESDRHINYEQVVATEGDTVTIQADGERLAAAASDVSRVAPIVALLLQHVQFPCEEWGPSELEAMENSILDQVLGRANKTASNDIPTIFSELLMEESYPDASKVCQWVNPKTGRQAKFPLQHALNFTYYVDGGVQPVPPGVGQSFWQPPTALHPNQGPVNLERRSVAEVNELFDPFEDDDAPRQEELSAETYAASPAQIAPGSGKRLRETTVISDEVTHEQKRQRAILDQDILIIEKLRGNPDLLDRFLTIRQGVYNVEHLSSSAEQAPTSPCKRAVVTAANKMLGSSKYAFVPREDQQRVHERVTSTKHKSKLPSVFVKGMIRSEHVKFKALPGVCTRVFNIQFGSGGLSIRHFARLSQPDRMTWLETGGSNFDNLSATAEFAPATPATSIEDVVDSVRVFLTYAREYCCAELVRLIERVTEFIEETLMLVAWSLKDVSVLVYWINDLLEEFRGLAEARDDLSQVIQRCSTDDRLLRDLMFVKVHRQIETLAVNKAASGSHLNEHRSIAPRPQVASVGDGKKRFGQTPREVLKQLPALVDPASGKSRSLCLRYLSKVGCDANNDGSCPSKRWHFVPKTLSADVKAIIIQRFGGLQDEYKHL